jgi:hypothetical protein
MGPLTSEKRIELNLLRKEDRYVGRRKDCFWLEAAHVANTQPPPRK